MTDRKIISCALCVIGQTAATGDVSEPSKHTATHMQDTSEPLRATKSSGVHCHKMTFRNDDMIFFFTGICGACQCSNIQTFFIIVVNKRNSDGDMSTLLVFTYAIISLIYLSIFCISYLCGEHIFVSTSFTSATKMGVQNCLSLH